LARNFPKLLDLFVIKGEVARNPDTFHFAFPLTARALLAISIWSFYSPRMGGIHLCRGCGCEVGKSSAVGQLLRRETTEFLKHIARLSLSVFLFHSLSLSLSVPSSLLSFFLSLSLVCL